MQRADGYLVIVGEGRPIESDTCQCWHCSAHVQIKAGSAATVYLVYDNQGRMHEEPGAFCRVCMHPICLACHARGGCTPFEKRLEQLESRDRLRRQVAGLTTG